MVKSMTGFGRGESRLGNGKITVEIKTVNHKYFDATLKLPSGMIALEDRIKEVLQKKIMRGKVSLNLAYDGRSIKDEHVSINQGIAKNYYIELGKLTKSLKISDGISIKDLILLPGVITYEVGEGNLSRVWPKVREAIQKAVSSLMDDREKEGAALRRDLTGRAHKIDKMLKNIRSRAHLNIEAYRKRFASRVKDLTGGSTMDMGRLEMEVAIFAKNCDISEEITRLQNHLQNFSKTITGNQEVGKKLDFIAQELHREINTIGSKASDFSISKNVIEVKSEIEKIREQAKNLE